ncbi:MAG: PD-(D/E)XK nuclease superfamily protein [Planctomycetota bacterium]
MAKKQKSSSKTTKQTPVSGGSKANATGNQLERFVCQTLENHGYAEFWNHKKQFMEIRNTIGGKQFAQQIPVGPTIYDTDRRCDIYVMNRAKFPDDLVIECKWQQAKGSVDEKYPYLLFNIIRTGIPTIVVIDGDGARPAAVAWLKSQVGGGSALLGVWDMKEFHRQANNGFLG